jgi:hypothetical protein
MGTLALGGVDLTMVFVDDDGVLFLGADLDFSHVSLLDVVRGLECADLIIQYFFGAEPVGGCKTKSSKKTQFQGFLVEAHGRDFVLKDC